MQPQLLVILPYLLMLITQEEVGRFRWIFWVLESSLRQMCVQVLEGIYRNYKTNVPAEDSRPVLI